uniref:Uncharacterized protein n=1 Tax=Orbilia brochopaga TaxID=3140254 RepID=A0A481ZN97_9PEZI|nr:hypothetical protein [Drechslerella brochopaga]QBL02567.1 hypothetical protein [Drechslerella brochopaga]
MGNVRTFDSAGVFEIFKQEEVQKLIDIFTNYPLNTTKHLNFVAWANGFMHLQNYKLTKNSNLLNFIPNLKVEMNNSRSDFNMPSDHSINITSQWFIGFLEGEGSVYVFRKDYTLSISIGQALIDKNTIFKVAEFLNQLPSANLFKSEDNVVKIYYSNKSINHPRGKIELVISQLNYIKSVVIPFFNSQQWHTKSSAFWFNLFL